jgi:5-formyltetrahydrofolate cyclo-ligase
MSFKSMSDPKSRLRKQMLSQRRKRFNKGTDYSDALLSVFISALAEIKPTKLLSIAGYSAIHTEIETHYLLRYCHALDYTVSLPALELRDEHMCMMFRQYDPNMTLEIGPYGIKQPPEDAPEVLPDIVLAPLLAFDRFGGRLGYGGGFYDRALDYLRGEKAAMGQTLQVWGVAFADQEVENVPTEIHDQPLDAIITEQGLIRPSSLKKSRME